MVDVFISYSRDDAEKVGMLARMIADEGYEVWWDADLPPHMSYGDVITAKIGAAKAAVVVWSDTAAKSEWVRAEADVARNQKKLIQTNIDNVMPPLPFNQIQCAAIGDWDGSADHRGWSKVKQSLVALCGPRDAADSGAVTTASSEEITANTPEPQKTTPANAAPSKRAAPLGSGVSNSAKASVAAPPGHSGGAPAKSGMSTPLIIALGCGGMAVLALIVLIALAVIGMTIEEPLGPDGTDTESIGAPVTVTPEQDRYEIADPVTDGDYIPQLEAAPGASSRVGSDIGPDMASEPSSAGFVIATIQDPDGYTNVRAGRSTRSAIVARVEEGDIFTTYQQSEAWWIVQLEDGTEGYIFADRIFVIGPQ